MPINDTCTDTQYWAEALELNAAHMGKCLTKLSGDNVTLTYGELSDLRVAMQMTIMNIARLTASVENEEDEVTKKRKIFRRK